MPLVHVSFSIERSDLDHLHELGQSIGAAIYYWCGQPVAVSLTAGAQVHDEPLFDAKKFDGHDPVDMKREEMLPGGPKRK